MKKPTQTVGFFPDGNRFILQAQKRLQSQQEQKQLQNQLVRKLQEQKRLRKLQERKLQERSRKQQQNLRLS